MTLLDFIALVLATGAVIDAWHNASILATPRAIAQANADAVEPSRLHRLWELLTCSYCQAFHIPAWFLAGWCGWYYLAPPTWLNIPWLLMYALAATRASQLLNWLLPNQARYDRDAVLRQETAANVEIEDAIDELEQSGEGS